MPRFTLRSARQIHQADDDFANGVAPFGHPEIEHEAGMADESLGQRSLAEYADEARLADSGIAAHEHGAAPPARRTAAQRRFELRQLRLPPDERMRSRAIRDVSEFNEAPCRQWRVDALHLRTFDRRAPGDALRGGMHCRIEHGLARASKLQQPRRQIDRVADHRVRAMPRAAETTGDNLARRDADVQKGQTRTSVL